MFAERKAEISRPTDENRPARKKIVEAGDLVDVSAASPPLPPSHLGGSQRPLQLGMQARLRQSIAGRTRAVALSVPQGDSAPDRPRHSAC